MAQVTPSTGYVDLRYGPDAHQRYDVARHPIRDPGGNPWILWRHGGGWNTNDKRQPFIAAQRGNALFAYLLNNKSGPNDAHFDVISYETRQAAWGTPNTTHTANTTLGWYSEVPTVPAFFPETFEDTQRCILAIKAASKGAGRDPNKGIIAGSSAGAVQAFWSQVVEPVTNARPSMDTRWTRYLDGGGFDSRVCGVLAHIMPVDFRKGSLTVQGCTWTEGTLTLTAPSGTPWATTKYATSNGTRVIVQGAGVTGGVMEAVVSSNTNTTLVLTGSISAAAGDIGAVLSVTLPGEVESVLESVWRNLFGTNALSETWLLPDAARTAVSPLAYIEGGPNACKWLPRCYLTYETYAATDIKPYATGHEGIQFDAMMTAAARNGLSDRISGNRAVGSWADSAQGAADTISEAAYQFMRDCLMCGARVPANPLLASSARR